MERFMEDQKSKEVIEAESNKTMNQDSGRMRGKGRT